MNGLKFNPVFRDRGFDHGVPAESRGRKIIEDAGAAVRKGNDGVERGKGTSLRKSRPIISRIDRGGQCRRIDPGLKYY